MDILTPKGQESLEQEQEAVALWNSHFPDIQYIQTPKDKPATVDALLIRKGEILGVVETKCRPQLTPVKFKMEHNSRWLITYEKIEKASVIAEGLCVPLVGFLYMPNEKVLLYKRLWEPKNGWVCDIETRETKTQATINGGEVVRLNAYVDMSDAKYLVGLE